jgi:ABC-type Fe3+ transport system permease subunit
MDPLLTFKAVSLSVIALCALTGLFLLLISARKERDFGPPLRGVVMFAFVVVGLCAALALLFAYQLQKQISEVQRLDRGNSPTIFTARPS